MLESGPCSNGKDWKVGLVGEVEEELRREPLDLLNDNINDIAGDVAKERYTEEVVVESVESRDNHSRWHFLTRHILIN